MFFYPNAILFYLIDLEVDSKCGNTGNTVTNKGTLLPWGAHKERSPHPAAGPNIDMDIKPGEFVMRSLFADFTIQAEKKIETVMGEPLVSYFEKNAFLFSNIELLG